MSKLSDLVARIITLGLFVFASLLYVPIFPFVLPFLLPLLFPFILVMWELLKELLVECGIVTTTDCDRLLPVILEKFKDVLVQYKILTKTSAVEVTESGDCEMKTEVTEETEKVPEDEKTKKDSISGKTAETGASGENAVVSDEGKDEEKVAEAAPEEVLCEVKVKTGYVSEETKDISSDSDETIEISFDSEDSDNKVDISKCDEKDIKLVMEYAKVTRSQAVKALLRNNNQCFETSVELIMKKLGFVQNH